MLTFPLAAARAGTARAPERAPLRPIQIRWLGALLLAAQIPHLGDVPAWAAAFGLMLVGARLLLGIERAGGRLWSLRISPWILAVFALVVGLGIRASFGYFLGRDPCVAFLFVLIGIKFLETHDARDATLLICLAGFLVVTPFFYGQSMLAALASAPALLLLGATLQVLARPDERSAAAEDWRGPLVRSARFFAQGIPLAAMLFVVFPRLSGPLWGLPADHAAQSGLSDRMSPGDISALSLSDAVAFRVDFDGLAPAPAQRYWRGPVLSRFDGREWRSWPGRAAGELASGRGERVSYAVSLEPHGKPWLFALDMPSSLPHGEGSGAVARGGEMAFLTRDQQLIAFAPITQPTHYEVSSVLRSTHPLPSGSAAAAQRRENLHLPPGNDRSVAFARDLRAFHTDELDYVRAVLDLFRTGQFVYTLAPQLLPGDPVDAFLFDTKRGFCEHYAGAFVVLLRAAGIPARVVTGYQGGEINPAGGYMIVRQSDAHAWAEAIIGGEWRRFDPTAAVAPSRIESGIGAALPATEGVPLLARIDAGWLKGLQLAWDAVNHDWRRHVVGFDRDRQRSMLRDLNLDRFAAWQIAVIVAVAVVAWLGLLLLWLVVRGRRRDRETVFWNRLCARLGRAGLPRLAHEGPVAYSRRAARRWPEFATALHGIGDAYASIRYGPAASRPASVGEERQAAIARMREALGSLPSARYLRRHAVEADAPGTAASQPALG
jgi:transglutaminase-like putative cysteine protease